MSLYAGKLCASVCQPAPSLRPRVHMPRVRVANIAHFKISSIALALRGTAEASETVVKQQNIKQPDVIQQVNLRWQLPVFTLCCITPASSSLRWTPVSPIPTTPLDFPQLSTNQAKPKHPSRTLLQISGDAEPARTKSHAKSHGYRHNDEEENSTVVDTYHQESRTSPISMVLLRSYWQLIHTRPLPMAFPLPSSCIGLTVV